jgi:hypothetical protein
MKPKQPFVWALVDGVYSDYKVVGVFSTAARARRLLAEVKSGKIERWVLDPAIAQLVAGLSRWTVWMARDGKVERAEQVELSVYDQFVDTDCIWYRTQAPAWKGKTITDVLDATVWAKDKAHAIKIVNERRLQLIAAGKWKDQ